MAFTERGALGLTNRSRPDARLVERDSVHRLREVERPSSDLFFMVLVYMIGHFGGLKKLPPRLYRRVLGNWPDANGETSLRSRFQSKETDAKAKKKTHTHTSGRTPCMVCSAHLWPKLPTSSSQVRAHFGRSGCPDRMNSQGRESITRAPRR